jgi:hypothetical protein
MRAKQNFQKPQTAKTTVETCLLISLLPLPAEREVTYVGMTLNLTMKAMRTPPSAIAVDRQA